MRRRAESRRRTTASAFDAIYPGACRGDTASLLYPFFLDGVAADAKLNQRDGLHPTAAGVDAIVAGILPKVEELIAPRAARRQLTGALSGHAAMC